MEKIQHDHSTTQRRDASGLVILVNVWQLSRRAAILLYRVIIEFGTDSNPDFFSTTYPEWGVDRHIDTPPGCCYVARLLICMYPCGTAGKQ
ncbi:MAG: hypothetical protein C4519_10320 [Desulfobacteraceae bacterium]|nr:MAG: hypothetical protein C4519_10320 [Desulfobacteraceae bacterium]